MTEDLSTIMKARLKVEEKTTTGLNAKTEKYKEIDMLYEDLKDLCNDQFRLWYCKQFNKIGRDRVLILASQARVDGKDQVKLFSHLLRKEIKK